MNKRFGVLGSPIAHSKSPNIHSAAYRVLNNGWSYDRNEVVKGGLKRFIENDNHFHDGFSLTMPLKENAFTLADETDDNSKLTGACNTLLRSDGRWLGFNTDIFGIKQAISQKLQSAPSSSLVLGSGATAYSAVVAISQIAPASVLKIYARNKKTRAELISFAMSLGIKASRCRFIFRALRDSELTISTLPGRAFDDISEKLKKKKSLIPGGLLLDVAYDPWPSKLAAFWSSRDQPVVSGLEMLIWQALAQIRIFTFGSADQQLPNEVAVIEAMRIASSE
jgi:shikimate dehydrogenase